MKIKKRNFTLVELLTVIVIISILAGLSSAALMRGRRQARRTEANLGAEALRSAISQYENDYGMLPSDVENIGGGDEDNPTQDYEDLIETLTADGNPRRINYISTVNGRYLDPWGQEYRVRLDVDYTGSVVTDDGTELNRSAIVWSDGDPTRDDGPVKPWK